MTKTTTDFPSISNTPYSTIKTNFLSDLVLFLYIIRYQKVRYSYLWGGISFLCYLNAYESCTKSKRSLNDPVKTVFFLYFFLFVLYVFWWKQYFSFLKKNTFIGLLKVIGIQKIWETCVHFKSLKSCKWLYTSASLTKRDSTLEEHEGV